MLEHGGLKFLSGRFRSALQKKHEHAAALANADRTCLETENTLRHFVGDFAVRDVVRECAHNNKETTEKRGGYVNSNKVKGRDFRSSKFRALLPDGSSLVSLSSQQM